MKLYYWPGACSLSPHIVSREAGIDLQLAQLDRAERKTADGTVLSSVNPKNQVSKGRWAEADRRSGDRAISG